MGGWHLRVWRRVKLAPGVRLNWSRSGPSLSLGPRGATLTVGRRGIRQTLGIPGTGIYVTRRLGGGHHPQHREVEVIELAPQPRRHRLLSTLVAIVGVVAFGLIVVTVTAALAVAAAILIGLAFLLGLLGAAVGYLRRGRW